MNEVYDEPALYELAFAFRDLAEEVDVLEECIRRYSTIRVTRMLEVGCGPASHLPQIARRGYQYVGLDLSEAMIGFARDRAESADLRGEWVQADMADFTLDEPVDFAFVMLGSIYADGPQAQSAHFDAVARALRPGGLYFLDWCVQFPPSAMTSAATTCWEVEADDVRLDVQIHWEPIDPIRQTFREHVVLQVDQAGRQRRLHNTALRKAIYPQEFLQWIAGRRDFEFVGWWNEWDLDAPLERAEDIDRPISLIRRV